MLDHGLEITAYALKLRQSHLLPAGATPEAQAAQAEAWTAGTAYAALLHDVGKVAVDLHVEHADGSVWHPWHSPLQRPYRFRYRPSREYRLHSAATGLLYRQALDQQIFDWLSGYPDLWAALLYVLAGQYEHAGTLGELVVLADQASVAQELGGVQRAAGSRHRATDAGWQGDLARHHLQRDRLVVVVQRHAVTHRAGIDLGDGRATGALHRHRHGGDDIGRRRSRCQRSALRVLLRCGCASQDRGNGGNGGSDRELAFDGRHA